MFKRLLAKLSPRMRRARERRRLAERLLISVEQLGAMRLDKTALIELGVNRKQAIRLTCHLLLKERIHMLTDSLGRLIVMSNPEFERSVRRRADGSHETEVRLQNGVKSLKVDEVENMGEVSRLIDAVCVEAKESPPAARSESDTVVFAAAPTVTVDYDWFDVDAPSPEVGSFEVAKLPPERQTLPGRRRVPWPRTGGGVREKE